MSGGRRIGGILVLRDGKLYRFRFLQPSYCGMCAFRKRSGALTTGCLEPSLCKLTPSGSGVFHRVGVSWLLDILSEAGL